MPTLLVAIPWGGSVVFTAVLCFLLGYWRKTTELQGRHAVGNVLRRVDPWESDENELGDEVSTSASSRARPRRWWSEDDDTEVMPVIEDAADDQ
ncbi:hypothetical protein [Nocardia nepalensis]|uniref:hypothetical protein n=1 Tax=Nocardia nepalensis TaxID=3375448 RepID=UPI003B66CC7B